VRRDEVVTIRVTVNGEYRNMPGHATVAHVVNEITGQTRGVAVAVNGDVVPRTRWPQQPVADGDAIEILTAVQGG
jgi:sulfur carrier protein